MLLFNQHPPIRKSFLFAILCVLLSTNAKNLPDPNESDENPGLYALDDNVEIFTVDNYKTKLYNQSHAWLFEFYSSWCGHCQRFAPIWKSFAADIQYWAPIVRLAAIDCAQEPNTPVCREFEILGYPTVRFFHENYTSGDKNIGENFKTVREVPTLRGSLIEKLIEEQINGRGQNWPRLTKHETTEISDLWTNVPATTRYVILVVEDPEAFMGAEVILDLHNIQNVSLKIIKKSNERLIQKLSSGSEISTPSLLVLGKDFTIIPITPRDKTREAFKKAVQLFCETKNIALPSLSPIKFNEDFISRNASKQFDQNENVGQHDTVYLVDLENTLHHALKHEIAVQTKISGDKLQALIDFFNVILLYFPFTKNGQEMYSKIRETIIAADSEISGQEILEVANAMEERYKPAYSQPLQWVRCRGSIPIRRGYPCGLWTLFHTLTVAEMKSNVDSTVLKAMLGYVQNFFGCLHCSQHFQAMAAERNLSRVHDPTEAVFWLWEAHNIVNKRLAGDETEDPKFPKVVFPKRSNCAECYKALDVNGETSWNRDTVLAYLQRIYSRSHIENSIGSQMHFKRSEESVTSASSRTQYWPFFSFFDVSLYFVLCLCSVGMLYLIIKIMFRQKYRKKAYLLGKV